MKECYECGPNLEGKAPLKGLKNYLRLQDDILSSFFMTVILTEIQWMRHSI